MIPGGTKAPRDLDQEIRVLISTIVHTSKRSIEEIADEMARALQRPVGVDVLRAMAAPSHKHRFPLAWLPAFCAATDDFRLLQLAADAMGLPVMDAAAAERMRLAQILADAQIARSKAESALLEAAQKGLLK